MSRWSKTEHFKFIFKNNKHINRNKKYNFFKFCLYASNYIRMNKRAELAGVILLLGYC